MAEDQVASLLALGKVVGGYSESIGHRQPQEAGHATKKRLEMHDGEVAKRHR